MAYCKNCGTQLDDGQNFCPNCGTAQDENTQENSNYIDGNNYSKENVQYTQNPVANASNGIVIGGLVCGILGLIFAFVSAIVGLILSIVGLILSNKAKKSGITGGMVTGGLVCSIIGLVLSVIMIIVAAACAATLLGAAASFADMY